MFFDFSFVTATLICFLISLFIYQWRKKYSNHYWKDKGISYEEPYTIITLLRKFFSKQPVHELEMKTYRKHGRYFGSYEMSMPVLFLSDPELLKLIMVKDFNNFNQRRDFNVNLEHFEHFVAVVKGEKWKRLRSIITPSFTSGKLRAMTGHIAECAEQLSNNLIKMTESGKAVDIRKIIENFALDVIATVAFGTKLDSHNDPNNIFLTKARQLFNFEFGWKLIFFLLFPRLFIWLGIGLTGPNKFFNDLARSIIERRRRTNEVRNDFLQILMEHLDDNQGDNQKGEDANRKVLSMDELVAQCVMFFSGGHDTVAIGLSLTILNLATNPEAQRKAVEEVDEFWKNKTDVDAATTGEVPYLEACISETLRMYPPATKVERQAQEDYVLGDTGVAIPKDMIVTVPVYCMHHDEEFYPEPEKFMPERFLSENSKSSFTYFPFGQGPRNCLAMRFALTEMKLCLLHLLKNMSFSPCPETKNPPEFNKAAGFLKPKIVPLNVTRRIVP